MTDTTVQTLFDNISLINQRYEELAEISGENFNIFKLLKVENDEVKTHSKFIAELLNPKGSHGQKDIFLQLFIASIAKVTSQSKIQFHFESLQITIEKSIGVINEDGTEGGRIDIIISDRNQNRIIIENKIYAKDQKNQLLRYYNFDKSAIIFYLNLFGDTPKDIDKNLELGRNFFVLSYKNDIIEWLQQCHEKTISHPILRETITQYIHLLKSLTNQTKHTEMSNEIIELITKSDSNFESSMLIANEFDSIKTNLLKNFWDDVKITIENKLNLQGKVWVTKNLNQTCPALFINTGIPNAFIALEPLNGKHFKSAFNSLFIGIFDKGETKTDNSGPFPEWRRFISTEFDFGDIKKTLRLILPNSPERDEIKNKIVSLIENYINNPDTIKYLTSKN